MGVANDIGRLGLPRRHNHAIIGAGDKGVGREPMRRGNKQDRRFDAHPEESFRFGKNINASVRIGNREIGAPAQSANSLAFGAHPGPAPAKNLGRAGAVNSTTVAIGAKHGRIGAKSG
jgi:hypothetical protein